MDSIVLHRWLCIPSMDVIQIVGRTIVTWNGRMRFVSSSSSHHRPTHPPFQGYLHRKQIETSTFSSLLPSSSFLIKSINIWRAYNVHYTCLHMSDTSPALTNATTISPSTDSHSSLLSLPFQFAKIYKRLLKLILFRSPTVSCTPSLVVSSQQFIVFWPISRVLARGL